MNEEDNNAVIQNLISIVVWIVVGIIFVLSILTYIAKKSLPGDRFYGFKLKYQAGVIAVLGAFDKAIALQIDYTKDRYDETSKVIDTKNAALGFSSLNSQIDSTTASILSIKDYSEQKNYADEYIRALQVIKKDLVKKKVTSYSKVSSILPTTVPASFNEVLMNTSEQTTIDTNNSSAVINQITETEINIDNTIHDLQQIENQTTTVYPTSVPTATAVPIIPTTITAPTIVVPTYSLPGQSKDKLLFQKVDDSSKDESPNDAPTPTMEIVMSPSQDQITDIVPTVDPIVTPIQ